MKSLKVYSKISSSVLSFAYALSLSLSATTVFAAPDVEKKAEAPLAAASDKAELKMKAVKKVAPKNLDQKANMQPSATSGINAVPAIPVPPKPPRDEDLAKIGNAKKPSVSIKNANQIPKANQAEDLKAGIDKSPAPARQ